MKICSLNLPVLSIDGSKPSYFDKEVLRERWNHKIHQRKMDVHALGYAAGEFKRGFTTPK